MYSCTSNGALRLTPLLREADAGLEQPRTAVLPMRLCAWRLAPDGTTFAYGGDEVELSVWDVETAFAPKQQPPAPPQSDSSKKRKRRSEMLLPGELWRAKNVCISVWYKKCVIFWLPARAAARMDRFSNLFDSLRVGRERQPEPTTARA